MRFKEEHGVFVSGYVLFVVIAVVIMIGVVMGYILFENSPAPQNDGGTSQVREIGTWDIYVNDEKNSIIEANSQSDGTAKWSGTVKIVVYDKNGTPMADVKILLDGCGITAGAVTPSNGTVVFALSNVTLPSGQSSGKIGVQISYDKGSAPQLYQDSIVVIRRL